MTEKSHAEAPGQALSQASEPKVPVYEVGFHLVPTLIEEKATAAAEALRAALVAAGAEIISEETPKKMKLAYVIERATAGKREKYAESYFGFTKFAVAREAIPGIETMLRNNREVLRHLLIETVREDVAPAPRRAVFVSDRLEGEVLKKPEVVEEKVEVSEEDLDKSIDALVA